MIKTTIMKIPVAAICLLFALTGFSLADTRLITLPGTLETAIRINEQNESLVQEKRLLPLKKGRNTIDFSWQNVHVDPSSVMLFPVSNTDEIEITGVAFPPDGTSLVWEINSKDNLNLPVMISYILAGIDGLITYNGTVINGETKLELDTHLVLRNFSGRNFEKAMVYSKFRKAFETRISHQETLRINTLKTTPLPVRKHYIWEDHFSAEPFDNADYGKGVPAFYSFDHPLHSAKVRLFLDKAREGRLFLGEAQVDSAPDSRGSSLKLGTSRDILVAQKRIDVQKVRIRPNNNGRLQVYDEMITDRIVMENLKKETVTLTVLKRIDGEWEPIAFPEKYSKKDHRTVAFEIVLGPGKKRILELKYKVLNLFAGKFSAHNRPVM